VSDVFEFVGLGGELVVVVVTEVVVVVDGVAESVVVCDVLVSCDVAQDERITTNDARLVASTRLA
jgi:hypothetical protein